MQQLEMAVAGLEEALTTPPRLQHSWTHLVRQRLTGVDEALGAERTAEEAQTWLSARAWRLRRERDRLRHRLSSLTSVVGDTSNVEPVREDLLRLVHDIQHHHQRVHDLAYDLDSMDVGGSE